MSRPAPSSRGHRRPRRGAPRRRVPSARPSRRPAHLRRCRGLGQQPLQRGIPSGRRRPSRRPRPGCRWTGDHGLVDPVEVLDPAVSLDEVVLGEREPFERSIGARRNETPRASTAMTGNPTEPPSRSVRGRRAPGRRADRRPGAARRRAARFRRRGSRPRAVARRHRQAVATRPTSGRSSGVIGRIPHHAERTSASARSAPGRSRPARSWRDAGVLGLRRDRRLPREPATTEPSVVGCNRVDVAGPTSSSRRRGPASSHRPVTVSHPAVATRWRAVVRHALERTSHPRAGDRQSHAHRIEERRRPRAGGDHDLVGLDRRRR